VSLSLDLGDCQTLSRLRKDFVKDEAFNDEYPFFGNFDSSIVATLRTPTTI